MTPRLLMPHQIAASDFLTGDPGVLLAGDPGTGKAQHVDCKVCTPYGWKRIGNLSPGDVISSPDGGVQVVEAVYPQGELPLLKFHFRDGTSTLCCAEHLWLARNRSWKSKQWRVVSAADMIEAGVTRAAPSSRAHLARGASRWQVPVPAPVECPVNHSYPIPPYTLGVLIGDGALTLPSVTFSAPDHKTAVLDRVKEELAPGLVAVEYTPPNEGCRRVRLQEVVRTGRRTNVYKRALEHLGLMVKSGCRFVPYSYLWGSAAQRLALLQGLMDTDGSCTKNRTRFHTTAPALAGNVVHLVRSLGGSARITVIERKGKTTEYTVSVKLPVCPFSVPAKVAAWAPTASEAHKPSKHLVRVEPAGTGPAVCIRVSGPSRTYITDGFIVTHNTMSTIKALEARGAKNILVTCPAIATSNWVREYGLAASPLVAVDAKRHPKRIKGADVVTISMDSMRTDFGRELALSRHWDALVVDEAHGCADPLTKRTRSIYDPALKIDKIVDLTGTPTPRHAGQLWTHVNRTAPWRLEGMTYDQFCQRYCVIVVKRLGNKRFAEPVITKNKAEAMPELRQRLAGWWLRQRKEDVLKHLPPKTYSTIDLPASKVDLKAIEDEVDPEVFEALEFAVETGDMRTLSLLSSQVATLRRLLAKAKVAGTADYVLALKEIDPANLPVSIWGWHTEPLRDIATRLSAAGLRVGYIDGSVGPEERDRTVQRFQEGWLDVFVGQIKAAGIAITLTRGWRAIFMEKSFVASDNAQAEDRHHRLGQLNHVQVDTMLLDGTIDAAVEAICARRQAEWEELSQESV